MKLFKTLSDLEKEAIEKLKEFYPDYETLAKISITWMNSLNILIRFISNNYSENTDFLPEETKYGTALGITHLNILILILTGKIKPQDLDIRNVPLSKGGFDHPEHLSDKMVLVVKNLYEELKKEGRISANGKK